MTRPRRGAHRGDDVVDLEAIGSPHLLRAACSEHDDERDDELIALLGVFRNATVHYVRFRGVRGWDGWVLRFWGILIDEVERGRSAKTARYWQNTIEFPPPATTYTYRAIRTEVRPARGRFNLGPPTFDKDVFNVDAPHFRESPLWARLEWPNGGRDEGYWVFSGVPFNGHRPTDEALKFLTSELDVAFEILVAGPPTHGRPSNVAKPHPAKVALAKRAWKMRCDEPALSWDQIAARLQTNRVGRTLQRWIEKDSLHTLE
jgi:hypothetical protein